MPALRWAANHTSEHADHGHARPTAGRGRIGTVHELGLFCTTIVMPDNVHTLIGNDMIFGDTIQNFSVFQARRPADHVASQHPNRLLWAGLLRHP
jgi:hypothetical protein